MINLSWNLTIELVKQLSRLLSIDRIIKYRVLDIADANPVGAQKYDYYVNDINNHYYFYNGTAWTDAGVASDQDEVINLADAEQLIYKFNGVDWLAQTKPIDGTEVKVENTGNGYWGLYAYSGNAWYSFTCTPGIYFDPVTGNIGVGTTAPIAEFTVARDPSCRIMCKATGDGNAYFVIDSGTDKEALVDLLESGVRRWLFGSYGPDGSNKFNIRTAGDISSSKFTILQNGNTGFSIVEPTALADLGPSTASRASQRMRLGTAPTVPNVGDMWHDSAGFHYRDNSGYTRHVAPSEIKRVYSFADLPAKSGDGYIHVGDEMFMILGDLTFDGGAGYKGIYIDSDVSPIFSGLRTIAVVGQSSHDGFFKSDDMGGAIPIFQNFNVYSDGSAKLWNINSTNPDGIVILNIFAGAGFNSLGSVSDVKYLGLGVEYVQNVNTGLTLEDNSAVSMQGHNFYDWFNTGAIFVSIKGTQKNVQINGNFFRPESNESCIYIDPAMTTTGGSIFGCAFDPSEGGKFYAPGSETESNKYWTVAGNSRIANSTTYLECKIAGNTFQTAFPALNAWVEFNVDPTKVVTCNYQRISANIPQWDYVGLEDVTLRMSAGIKVKSVGTGKVYRTSFSVIKPTAYTITFDNVTDTVIETGTARVNGDSLRLYTTGTLPPELSTKYLYFVVSKTTNGFQLAYIPGGAPITFTTNGAGVHSYRLSNIIDEDDFGTFSTTLEPLRIESLEALVTDTTVAPMIRTETSPLSDAIIDGVYAVTFQI